MSDIKTQRFNDTDIHVIPFKGQPCFIASEVGAALGYKDPKDFTRKLTGDWSNEFIEGLERFKVEGDDLSRLRIAVGDSPTAIISSMARSLLLLTREGVWLACAKANTEQGVAFRRWLARELLPAIQDGRLTLDGDVPLAGIVSPPMARDTEASRLLMRGADSLARDGAIAVPERSFIYLRAMEMAVGETLPHLRRGIARCLPRINSTSPAPVQLPLPTGKEDAA